MNHIHHSQKWTIHTLDLQFLGLSGVIAAYMIPHSEGVVLIESGPGTTVGTLVNGLESHGYSPGDISDVFLTHIHLDHAGAAGWLAERGARIHVHPVGAPHMLDPHKLLGSAERIYGDQMDALWGEFLPVPEDRISILENNQVIEVSGLQLRAVDTPGHANHHFAYIFEDTCFSGDIGGVRLGESKHLVLPMPPPEFQLEDWRASQRKLENLYQSGAFQHIAPTHFGMINDAGKHLSELRRSLDEVGAWIEGVMPANPDIQTLNDRFLDWTHARYRDAGLHETDIQAYEAANPSWMSAAGIHRYWRKYRQN
jgi:glyoxylase-like metal-dependent hydrolase (beta-lactamase superfamily II)